MGGPPFCVKKGDLYVYSRKIFHQQKNVSQNLSEAVPIETAHAAMQPDYQEELKKRHLDRSDEDATADDVENMENYNVFVHSNKDSQDNGAPLAFASFCDDYPNREWTVLHI